VSVTRAVSVLFLSCFALGIAISAPARADEGAPHHEATESGEAEAPGSINWFDFSNKEQPPYAALFINFGLLAYGYYRFGKKPVADALKKHKESIAKEIEEAQRMKHEAEGRAKQYQSKLEHLETELAETKNLLEEAGKGEHDRIVKDAEEKAARMQKDAVFMLEQESKQLRLDLQKETVLAALGAAEELLKKRVTPADQERLAEEFLASLEQRATFSAGTAEKSRS
jgi:F-type H+-transporting ATPase subunit b